LQVFIFGLAILTSSAYGQNDSLRVYELGTVHVEAPSAAEYTGETLSASTIAKMNKLTVSESVNLISGITLSANGPRNESLIFIRGFDLRQVPIFIDGIPVYVPYDGYADLNRFTVFDLSQIQISKGGSSVLYGANTLGGAVNLVTQKPKNPTELNGFLGWLSGGQKANVNAGILKGKFYGQLGLSHYKRDFFPMSNRFTPTRTEDGGNRNNSFHTDNKLSFKIGFTPSEGSEYSISYITQQAEKGTPSYTGQDTLNPRYDRPRYWRWPKWNKESLYFISKSALGPKAYLKTRLFYDAFENELKSYDDANFNSQEKPYAFTSIYDDYTLGGSLEVGLDYWENHFVKFAAHYKKDVHRESGPGLPELTQSDYTVSLGFEDAVNPSPRMKLIFGINWNARGSIRVDQLVEEEILSLPSNRSEAINGQVMVEYQLRNPKNRIFTMAARKTRFATLKDRYSFRLGIAIPNPDLNPENAWNFEYGLDFGSLNRFSFRPVLFYSALDDVIQTVNNAAYDEETDTWVEQQQNAGRARFFGFEIPLSYEVSDKFLLGAHYTFIRREQLGDNEILFTDVPENKGLGFFNYTMRMRLEFMGSVEYNSDRFSTTYGTVAEGFILVNLKARYEFRNFLSVEAGVNNLGDQNYSLVEGYPESGRNYFVTLAFDLDKR
jgi:iron complex outermembrane receptor protein